MNGREALAQIMETNPDVTVLMLTVSEDGEDLTECMRLGASGYLLKKIDADFLLQSIRRAVAGDNVISPEMTSALLMRLRTDKPTPPAPESTVKVHVQSVLRKLNIRSRVQAAVFAVEHHLDKI